jgi:UDP-3-O-[3-hydroxymyristoyl] glucosamine N-acyltransferase
MADPRFFARQGPFRLGDLVARSGATLAPDADADREIVDVAPLETAGRGQLTFFDNAKYAEAFKATAAAACIVAARHAKSAPRGVALLLSERP